MPQTAVQYITVLCSLCSCRCCALTKSTYTLDPDNSYVTVPNSPSSLSSAWGRNISRVWSQNASFHWTESAWKAFHSVINITLRPELWSHHTSSVQSIALHTLGADVCMSGPMWCILLWSPVLFHLEIFQWSASCMRCLQTQEGCHSRQWWWWQHELTLASSLM